MGQKKNLTLDGMTLPHSIHILVTLISTGVCLYLTKYYFDSHYPTSLVGGASFCDLSSFWNCDAATYSPMSNFMGVPVAFFGLVVNLIYLMGSVFPSESMEKTSSFIAKFNIVGCIVLFIYSLVALGSLCPLCTLYYTLSGITFYLFFVHGIEAKLPDFKILAIWGGLFLLGSAGVYSYSQNKEEKQVAVNKQIINQFFELPNLGDPDIESPFKLLRASENFNDAPIRISIFSDFQCPFCKVLNEQFHKLERLYEGKMNINYYFFPLDSECNQEVKRQIHPLACKAAYLSACDPSKFKAIHDDIFSNQEKLSMEMLNQIEKANGLSGCLSKTENKQQVEQVISQSKKFNLRSTPTLIINGVKIEGSLKIKQYMALFDEIIKRGK